MNIYNTDQVERGSAVITRGSNVIGIVTNVSQSQGLAWVIWPDRCGLSECQPIDHLQAICDRGTITEALQVIAPTQQLGDPLARAFLNGTRSQASTEIVEDDDDDNADRVRPYYRPKAGNRH